MEAFLIYFFYLGVAGVALSVVYVLALLWYILAYWKEA